MPNRKIDIFKMNTLTTRKTKTTRLLAVVLAGGQSSRMGKDKSHLRLDGQTLLDRAVALLKKAGIEAICISGTHNRYPCVPDIIPQQGPLGGIWSVMNAHPETETFLIMPVDMPRLSVQIITTLLSQPNNSDLICYEKHPLPLLLSAQPAVRETIKKCAHSPNKAQRSIRELKRHLKTTEIPLSSAQQPCFVNINTALDFHDLTHTQE
jgi:molybdenum cofactor guanylyltransferase